MFLPTTPEELTQRKIKRLDIILITGDAYIDSPFMGVSLIGRVLESAGFSVGIIAQPDTETGRDISRLGEPRLFWGITGGAVDSMVANYTASKKRRKQDDYTPGGVNEKRPDRAVLVYANLVRRFFKNTAPIVLGGIEASLRRIAHYDFWSNRVRRSILFDAKADYLAFGMAHGSIVRLAEALKTNTPDDVQTIPGIAYISHTPKGTLLPSFEAVSSDKGAYADSFKLFYANTDPVTADALSQQHGDRFLNLNPPAPYSTTAQLDAIHALPFQRDLHPFYKAMGKVKALETIRFSIPTHYGCYGECNFCAITVHQGRTVRWRSQKSILAEAKRMTRDKDFKGYIFDLGGPTANMYGYECTKKLKKGSCPDRRCLFPKPCPSLKPDHRVQLDLLSEVERLPRVKKVFINSGIRYDLILTDKAKGNTYLKKLVRDHVSGQMKVAPEHTQAHVLSLMGKQTVDDLLAFKKAFDRLSAGAGKKQFLTYYLIAAHPGCTAQDMARLKEFTREKLNISPEQVQIFTPTPSTYSTLMYYTGRDPFTGDPIFVEKDIRAKERQKLMVTEKPQKKFHRNAFRKKNGPRPGIKSGVKAGTKPSAKGSKPRSRRRR
ncbi:MAG TPA: YgiQ family radical SAM protein [Desulfobacteraceae bacterium]|nr:YgiQ family radical SAM protein [Desulfobacteraceae bacterium]